MVAIQTLDEIQAILARLEGEEIVVLQVLGINSLKSFSPMPDALAGDTIESSAVSERHFRRAPDRQAAPRALPHARHPPLQR